MLDRQKQVLEAFIRAADWLTRHPPRAGTPIAAVHEEFREVVARADRAAAHQRLGHRTSRGATSDLRAAVRELRNRHLRPLGAIARASRDELVGIECVCTLPPRRRPITNLLADVAAIRSFVEQHAALFIACGRDDDFVAQLEDAIARVKEKARARERAKSLHVGATAGLREHLLRARKLIEIIDCHVSAAYAGDGALLAQWRVARRVQLPTGVRHRSSQAEAGRAEAGRAQTGQAEDGRPSSPPVLVAA